MNNPKNICNGSMCYPTFFFEWDYDTGCYWDSTNRLAWTCAGSKIITADSEEIVMWSGNNDMVRMTANSCKLFGKEINIENTVELEDMFAVLKTILLGGQTPHPNLKIRTYDEDT